MSEKLKYCLVKVKRKRCCLNTLEMITTSRNYVCSILFLQTVLVILKDITKTLNILFYTIFETLLEMVSKKLD